jgi:hypothetical protein
MSFRAQPLPSIQTPISIGELLDKISILEIKAERIIDSQKLKNVNDELGALRAIASNFLLDGNISNLINELKIVNIAIWDVENILRECEGRQDFGDDFISSARAVYKNNDRRAEIKKILNTIFGSTLVEEKHHSS